MATVRPPIKNFRDLRVWQCGIDLVERVYRLTEGFPKHEIYGLTGQMRRAAVSVPSNIAEGHSREHSKEYLNHLSIAQGSLAELQTQLEIASRLNYISSEAAAQLVDSANILSRQVYALRNAVRVSLTPDP